MSQGAEFVLSLLDRLSQPAKAGSEAMKELEAQLKRVDSLTKSMSRIAQFEQLARGFQATTGAARESRPVLESWTTTLSQGMNIVSQLAGALRALAGAFLSAAGGAAQFVVGQMAFHQSTMTSLGAVLHGQGPGAAREEFGRSLQLATRLPGDTSDFVSSRRQLATLFTNARERDVVFALSEDLANLDPEHAHERRGALVNVLGQIRGQDRVLGNDLLQLQTAGLPRTLLFDAIARQRGLQGTEAQRRNQARALLSSGAVHGDEAIRAMVGATEGITGQRIGGFSLAQGNSITGLMSNIQSGPATIIQTLLAGDRLGPAQAGLTRFLQAINSLFDSSTPRGERLLNIFSRLINEVFGGLGSIDVGAVLDRVLDVLEAIITGAEWLWKNVLAPMGGGFFRGIGAVLGPVFNMVRSFLHAGDDRGRQAMWERLGRALGYIAGVLVVLAGWGVYVVANFIESTAAYLANIVSLVESVIGIVESAVDAVVGVGDRIVLFFEGLDLSTQGARLMEGLINGITAGAEAVWAAIRTVGEGVVTTVETVFGIHSPSRVMMDLGAYVSQGFSMGIDSGAPGAGGSLAALVPNPGALDLRGIGGGGIGVGEVSLSVHSNADDPEGVAREVHRILPSALANALRELAMQQGVA